jgi:hypothetical protein
MVCHTTYTEVHSEFLEADMRSRSKPCEFEVIRCGIQQTGCLYLFSQNATGGGKYG